MSVTEMVQIDDHYSQAQSRLHQFIKDIDATLTIGGEDFNGWEAMVHAFVSPAQGLEDVMFEMLAERSITTAVGVNLNRIGQIVGAPREGLPDNLYLNRIFAQIFANNSNTTARDLLSVVTAMAGEELISVKLSEDFPAKVNLNYLQETTTVVDNTNNNLAVRTSDQEENVESSFVFEPVGTLDFSGRIIVNAFNLRFFGFQAEMQAMATELVDFVNGGTAFLEVVSFSAQLWRFESSVSPSPAVASLVTGNAWALAIDLVDMNITKDGVPKTPAEADAEFTDMFDSQEVSYDSNNPNGIPYTLGTPSFEDVTVAEGSYFPHIVAGLLQAAIESAPSWTETIVVEYDIASRKYTLRISDAFPNGEIRMDSFGPLVGYDDGEFLSGLSISDAIPGPVLEDLVLLDALEQAKAAGVDLTTTTQAIVDVFQFSNSSGGLGFASQLADFTWVGLTNYAFYNVAAGTSIDFIAVGGLFPTFRIYTFTANAAALFAELQAEEDTGVGGIAFYDAQVTTRQIVFRGKYFMGNLIDDGGGRSRMNLNIYDTADNMTLTGTLYVDGQSVAAVDLDSGFTQWNRNAEAAFDVVNPVGLGGGVTIVPTVQVGGGSYPTVIT